MATPQNSTAATAPDTNPFDAPLDSEGANPTPAVQPQRTAPAQISTNPFSVPLQSEQAPASLGLGPSGQPNPRNVYQAAPEEQTPQGSAAALASREAQYPILTGIGKGAESLLAPVLRPVDAVVNLVKTSLPFELHEDFKRVVPIVNAYENSRAQGKGILDSLSAANQVAGKQSAARQALDDAIMQYKKAPTETTAKWLTQAAGTVALIAAGGASGTSEETPELAAGTEEAEAAPTAAAKPGIVQQIVKGKNVAQPQAQAALREAGSSVTPTVAPASLRESLTAPINTMEDSASSLYSQIDDASGTNFKTLADRLRRTNAAIRASVDDAEEARLEARRSNIQDSIDDAKQTALAKGVDPDILNQADAQFKRMSALTDLQAKVFKNPSVISGNVAHGTEETVNVDNAIKALQKLQDDDSYGAPRLEQALGKQGAKQLLDSLYDAQRQGVRAVRARWIAGIIGGAVATGAAGRKVLGAATAIAAQ